MLFSISLFLLALIGAPLFAVFLTIVLRATQTVGTNPLTIFLDFQSLTQAPTLITIPFFTFAGYLLSESRAPQRLVDVAKAMVSWMPGGLAIVTIAACSFFTAFTGASGVTIIAMGGLLYPILMKEKYGDKFSLGLVTSCGSLGLLLPPSLPVILYGVISKSLIQHLFLAGILPCLLLIVLLSFYSMYVGEKHHVVKDKFNFKVLCRALWVGKYEWPIPIFIVAGMFSGWFTPSEAAPVTAFYVLIVEAFIFREICLRKDLIRIIKESLMIVGGIMLILGISVHMTRVMILQGIPDMLFNWISAYIHSAELFKIILVIFLLIVGCLMDIFSAIIVVVPLIVPIAKKYGMNDLHLAIIFLTTLEIGYLTPPVGMNLFLSSFRFRRPVLELYYLCIPFMLILLVGLLIITYVPWLSTALPAWLG